MRILKLCSLALASLSMISSCSTDGTQAVPVVTSGGSGATTSSNGGTSVNATGGAATGGSQVVSSGGTSQGGTATGGKASTGGTSTGGAKATGGSAISTGGAKATGGSAISTGGATSTGGSATTGGVAPIGGNASTGGAMATGGKTSAGGTTTTGGSVSVGGSTSIDRPCPTDGTVCKIMPFGDSITDGYNGDTPGGYRVELFRLAHSAGKSITFVGDLTNGPSTVDGVAFPTNHEGHSGWTIAPKSGRSGISTLVATVMPKHKPHIVLLMIGTNDAIDNYDMTNAPTRLGALIDSIYAQLPTVTIVVAQPVPSRGDGTKGDDTALSARIKTFDDAIPAVVKSRTDAGKHILVVDMYTAFNANKAALIEDEWHPNLAGYVLLGSKWYSAIQSLL